MQHAWTTLTSNHDCHQYAQDLLNLNNFTTNGFKTGYCEDQLLCHQESKLKPSATRIATEKDWHEAKSTAMSDIQNVAERMGNVTGGLGNVTAGAMGPVSGNMGPTIVQWQGWTTLSLIGCMLIALVAELAPPYMVMMGTLIIFLPLGILNIEEAFHGFSDEAMLSVAVLFVVAKGIEQSGGLEYVSSLLFSTKKNILKSGRRVWKSENSITWVLLKFSVPVAIFSAFLANIPLVAMMIPPIVEFSTKVNMAPSKLLLPLSFAALLGGTMTLIGASTNLVVLSMAAKKVPDLKMNLFEIGVVGVPVTVAGLLYILALSGKLLPDRLSVQHTTFNAREYSVVLVIKPTSSLARKTVEQAGLNRQPGLTLLQIERDGRSIPYPPGDFVMLPKDHLQFTGVIDSVLSLTQLDGLALSEDEGQQQVDLNRLNVNQCLVEAVVAAGSPMVRKRVAELQFRARYKAAIVAVHRHAKVINCPIGKLDLAAGDCLLMVADGSEFVTKHRNNSTFALVAKLPGFVPIQRRKAVLAAVIVFAMVVASAIGVELITAALFACAGLLIFRCLTPRDAMDSLEMPVLIMISAAFGISEAMVQSGAADLVAKALMGLAGKTIFGLITCTYIATTVFSLAITNSAAVTIMFPVALAAATQQNLDFRPFAYTLMMASSAGLMTPTGCPTNIMVYGPGGYKFADYLKYGGLLQIWLLIVTVGVTVTIQYWWAWWLAIIPLTICLTPLFAGMKFNMPRAMPLALSDGANEHPTAPLNLSTDSSALDVAESMTPNVMCPSNFTSCQDNSRDTAQPAREILRSIASTVTSKPDKRDSFSSVEKSKILEKQCSSSPQPCNDTSKPTAEGTRSLTKVQSGRADVPLHHAPHGPEISLEKIKPRHMNLVPHPQTQEQADQQLIEDQVPHNFRKVSGFSMASWSEPPSGYFAVTSSSQGTSSTLEIDYRNTPPPPYPGTSGILRDESTPTRPFSSNPKQNHSPSFSRDTTTASGPLHFPSLYSSVGIDQTRRYTTAGKDVQGSSGGTPRRSIDLDSIARPASPASADSVLASLNTQLRRTSMLGSEQRTTSLHKRPPMQ